MLTFTIQVDANTRQSLTCEPGDLIGALGEGSGTSVSFSNGTDALILEKLADIALQHETLGVPVPAFLVG